MTKATWLDRLRYATDNVFSKGTPALILWLGIVSLVIILGASLFLQATGMAQDLSFPQLLWSNLMHTMDAGTVAGNSGSWAYLFTMFGVTLGGIFVLSLLIGILTTGIEGRLENLRKGRSRVVESGHTVILGWSDQIIPILSELIVANANQHNPCIVILGPKDKIEMEDEIRSKLGGSGRTRIVCRNGDPIEMSDLALASPQTARSIIILAPPGRDADADAEVIKTLLAITNAPDRRPDPYHIVVEIQDPKNYEVARMVGKDEVEIVLIGDLISRIIAQTCRQSGLSIVYTELLDFDGNEIYFKHEPSLFGRTFSDALFAYETSTVIGIQRPGRPAELNPPMETLVAAGDQLIVISQDDDTIQLFGRADFDIADDAIHSALERVNRPERALILGWNKSAPAIINELDRYVAPGSLVTVVADYADGEAEIAASCTELQNQSVVYQVGDTTDRRVLNELDVAGYDHIITLSYSDKMEPQQADAHTLVTLLHLRDMAGLLGMNFSIVSEMLDNRNRNLAEVTQADDFIVSNRLISLMLSQISENKALNAVFAEIFDADGSEIYLRPAAHYVRPDVAVNFYTIVEAARRHNETAIGYRLISHSTNRAQQYGVCINPNKAAPITLTEGDMVIVLAAN
ncbi:potassium transporter TrkA [bacterium]|nr:potassium transporter TrkA [bacterium]